MHKRKTNHHVISRHGFYGVVRHPMYLAGFIFFTALMMNATLAQFLGYLILAVYMIIGTFREDKRLAIELGAVYRNYQKEVPMFLPGISGKKLNCH
jgi:protein-S-isoprenylcysteine O-methyltransferase Ste14